MARSDLTFQQAAARLFQERAELLRRLAEA